jgi:hypothetical protein
MAVPVGMTDRHDAPVEDDATIVARLRSGDDAMFAELLGAFRDFPRRLDLRPAQDPTEKFRRG